MFLKGVANNIYKREDWLCPHGHGWLWALVLAAGLVLAKGLVLATESGSGHRVWFWLRVWLWLKFLIFFTNF
jgi:hypothetical protein